MCHAMPTHRCCCHVPLLNYTPHPTPYTSLIPRRNKPAGKKKQKGSKSGGKPSSKALWSSAQGWAAFDAADELLLGAEEGGFAGLEVLEDVSLIDAGGC
jgi:ATP-dependent RNA helicase DDX24/MAK5